MPDELNNLSRSNEPRFTNETRTLVPNPELDQILDHYLDDLQNGRACSREALLAEHPEVADELAECLDGIEMVSGLGVGSDLIPQRLGDFKIIRPIGRGAMGVVYLANQVSLKRPVALKVLKYSVSGKQATARFTREAELVATLQHPNIVPIYANGKHDNHHFLAMQLIEGPSLSQWSAAKDADRNSVTLAKWATEVARALAHAHQRDVIHRDVKPSNLLQDKDQKIWLTDFGLARRFDDLRMSMTGAMLGTPNYMSPEQASASRYPTDHRTDIYSLGATLFELLTGRCVFLAETPHAVLAQVLTEEPPLLRDLLPEASRDLETILMKCLQKEPSDRYQSADQLADDLEAYSQGNSIKARRPSVIEQAIRWRRHNQKAVAWAVTAATTAVTMLAITVASWIGWSNSQHGKLQIKSDEGPIVGRLIDADGESSQTFSIPTQQPMPVKEGRYTLQMWDGGKLGENQDLFIEHGKLTICKTQLTDNGVFDERTVKGISAVLPLDGRDDLIFFHDKGITRVDGRTGTDLWTAEAKNFVKAANKLSRKEKEGQRNKDSEKRESVQPIEWLNARNFRSYDDHRLPVVTSGFPDVNQDGQREVMIASHENPVLFAFDGKRGELLWHYVAVPTIDEGFPHHYAGSLDRPRDIGDIDGDGVHDFAVTFFSKGVARAYLWLDAVSGKTGEKIWRLEMPEKWFDKANHIVSDFCQIDGQGRNPSRHIHTRDHYRDGMSHRNSNDGFVIPWPTIVVPAEDKSKSLPLILSCGTKLLVCDAKTGEATDFNQGDLLDLGFVPALPPKLIRSGVKGDAPIGVLLCEQVALPDLNTSTKAVTRFSMWSLETAQQIWHYDAASDPGWTGVMPDWPLVVDLVGDSAPEILVADGADLEMRSRSKATCLASLQALDALTGEPVWNTSDVARIRNQDRQVQRVLHGPDADGDQRDDVYVVSPMTVQGNVLSIFVDILSGQSGKRIRTTASEATVFEGSHSGIDLEQPFFLGVGVDGYPRLVVASKKVNFTSNRESTLIISTGTGEVTHVGDQLEHPLRADGDGDGNLDLFLIKPRSRGSLSEAGQLVSLKSFSGREKTFIGNQFVKTDDVDHDGVLDLVTDPQSGNTWQALSGATGVELWQWEFQPQGRNITPLNKDVDGDNINDYLMGYKTYRGGWDQLSPTLISGHKGRLLWQKDLTTGSRGNNVEAKCDDMNGDGVNDVVLVYRHKTSRANFATGSLRVCCFDGMSGAEHWHFELAPAGSKAIGPFFKMEEYPIRIVDVNDDGSPDVLCGHFAEDETCTMTALSGRSGEVLWQQAEADTDSIKFHNLKLWRTAVLNMGPGQKKKYVTAIAHESNAKAQWSVQLKFYDFEEQRPVSTWTEEGRFRRYPSHSNYPPQHWNGVPFEIVAGDDRYTGVCKQDRNANEFQIVVLDSSYAKAIEVQRIDVPLPQNVGAGYVWEGQFLIADANRDGRTDVIFHDGSDLIATDLVSGKELNRKPMPNDYRMLMKVHPKTSLIQMITSTDEDERLKLIDLKTLDTVWDMHKPSGFLVDGLLSGGQPDASNAYVAVPRVLYKDNAANAQTTQTFAMAAEYMGKDAAINRQISLAAMMPISKDEDNGFDPRMIEPLPWAAAKTGNYSDLTPVVINSMMIVVGAFVIPFFYIRYLVVRKRWALQAFMLLPLLFVVPYLVLQLPLEINGDQPARQAAGQFGIQVWMGKLLTASVVLPAVVFLYVWIRHLWFADWKRLIRLSIAAIVISIVIGLLTLSVDSLQLPIGSSYDWYDWSTAALILCGVWFIGISVMVKWVFAAIGRPFGALKNQVFRRTQLASS